MSLIEKIAYCPQCHVERMFDKKQTDSWEYYSCQFCQQQVRPEYMTDKPWQQMFKEAYETTRKLERKTQRR